MSHVKDILNEVKRCCIESLPIDTLPNYGIIYQTTKQKYVRLDAVVVDDDPALIKYINVMIDNVLSHTFKHDQVYYTRSCGEYTTTYVGQITKVSDPTNIIASSIEVTTSYTNVLERPVTSGIHTETLTSVCYCLLAYMKSLTPKRGDPVQTFITKWLCEHQRDIWIGMCLPVTSQEEWENSYTHHCKDDDY